MSYMMLCFAEKVAGGPMFSFVSTTMSSERSRTPISASRPSSKARISSSSPLATQASESETGNPRTTRPTLSDGNQENSQVGESSRNVPGAKVKGDRITSSRLTASTAASRAKSGDLGRTEQGTNPHQSRNSFIRLKAEDKRQSCPSPKASSSSRTSSCISPTRTYHYEECSRINHDCKAASFHITTLATAKVSRTSKSIP
ncbi:hypothetical protein DL96DRAFT_891190 [Flagelloscypha sp. PMI_526]|nr:hypothetical protein DL96DRAFT_891190 [Flagelloscypha sp. PMI_526]